MEQSGLMDYKWSILNAPVTENTLYHSRFEGWVNSPFPLLALEPFSIYPLRSKLWGTQNLFCNAKMWSYLAAMHLISVGGWLTFCNYRPFLSPFSFPHPSLFAAESCRSMAVPEQVAAPPNADIRRTHIPTTRLPARCVWFCGRRTWYYTANSLPTFSSWSWRKLETLGWWRYY